MKNLMKETTKWPNPIYIRIGAGNEKIISKKKNLNLEKRLHTKKGQNIYFYQQVL